MSLPSKTFYVKTSAADAYREWKSLLHLPEANSGEGDCFVIEDKPDQELRWLSRWGIAHIDGKADFIPADGGCVVYLSLSGIGALSRLLLTTASTLERGPWHYVNAFQQLIRNDG